MIFSRLGSRTRILGLGFLLVGSMSSFMFLGLSPFEEINLIVLIFPLAGLLFLLSAGWLVINPKRQRFLVVDGIFFLFRREIVDFESVKHFEIVKRIYRTKKGSKLQYAIEVILTDERRLNAGDTSDLLKTRRHAERLAKLMRSGCWDKVSGHGQLRPFSELDMSLRQKLKANLNLSGNGEVNQMAPVPRVSIVRKATDVAFLIAPKGFTKKDQNDLLLFLIFGIAIAVFAGYALFHSHPEIFWPVTLMIITYPTWWECYSRQEIHLSRSQFVIIYSLFGISLKKSVAVDKVEELIDSNAKLVLRSDTKEIGFGQTLKPQERSWLRQMIFRELQNG